MPNASDGFGLWQGHDDLGSQFLGWVGLGLKKVADAQL